MSRCVLIVPLRDFTTAKSRLSDVLSAQDRSRLARLCAERVLDRHVECDRFVVCDDDEVESWSQERGVACVRVASQGLNAALQEALPIIRARCPGRDLVVAHGDIVDPAGLDEILDELEDARPNSTRTNVIIVPDRRRDGTNVLRLDAIASASWTFQYGPGSFDKHVRQARDRGLHVEVRVDEGLSLDLDVPDDLTHPVIQHFLDTHVGRTMPNRIPVDLTTQESDRR